MTEGEERRPGPVPRYELDSWLTRHRIRAGITCSGEGSPPFDLGLWGTAPVGEVLGRWRAFRQALGEFGGMVLAHQVHGTRVLRHESVSGWVIHEGADGHLTGTPGVVLTVTVADCIPVYLADPGRRRIALLHAGWRGTAAGILAEGVSALASAGSPVDSLWMHCGVGICGECYEVGREVLEALGLPVPEGGTGRVDLRAVLREQARGLGVGNISTSPFCSMHDAPRFFSHRRSRGADGRMVAYLALLP